MFTLQLLEGGSEAGIGWMVWVALAIFFVMVFLGWLVASKGWLKKEEEPILAGHGHAEPPLEAHAPVAAPVADDLTSLEGIGPKVATVLNGIGIKTFADLANADAAQVRQALDAAGYKYMDPAGWFEQAKLAADGDTEGLKKLQDSLQGGRKA